MTVRKRTGPSQLLKLKSWLTLDEASTYLSMIIEEDIREVEILRLVLDGYLKLSVNFVNPVAAIYRELITPELKSKMALEWKKREKDYNEEYCGRQSLFLEEIIEAVTDGSSLKVIQGVWDLPLIGAEIYDVENKYYSLSNGPYPERLKASVNSCGAYVEDENGKVMQLHQNYEVTESDKFLPSYCLPQDCLFVVRTKALINLHKNLLERDSKEGKDLSDRTRITYLNIIGALLEITTGTFKDEIFKSETQLREFIAEKFDDLRGVSLRNTADIFAAAKRALNDDLD